MKVLTNLAKRSQRSFTQNGPQIMQASFASRQPTVEQKMQGLAAAQESSANWFAAYTNSHHEKRVASHFGERQIESFLPLYATLHRWKNRCEVDLDLPLFPNYVFVHIDPRDRVRMLEVPGVLSLVGFVWDSGKSSPILLCRRVARQASLDPRPTQANRSAIYQHRLRSAGERGRCGARTA
jgi:hypothetical protein